jgi:hypothetical protein
MATLGIQKSMQGTTLNHLSGNEQMMANLCSVPVLEADRNKSQVTVKDYLSHMGKDPVLMNIQSISRIMSPQQAVKPLNKTHLSKTVIQAGDARVQSTMRRNNNSIDTQNETLDLKRFNDMFNSNDNVMKSIDNKTE